MSNLPAIPDQPLPATTAQETPWRLSDRIPVLPTGPEYDVADGLEDLAEFLLNDIVPMFRAVERRRRARRPVPCPVCEIDLRGLNVAQQEKHYGAHSWRAQRRARKALER